MINEKLIKSIISVLLIFCVCISTSCAISVLKSDCYEKSENLIAMRKVGEELGSKVSEYLKKCDNVKEIITGHQISKSSVIFNDTIFKQFDELKYIDEKIRSLKNYIKTYKCYDKNELRSIKENISKLIIEDEYIKKLSLTIFLIEIKYGHLDKCSKEYIEDLMVKRMKYILLTDTSICSKYSFILKYSLLIKRGINETIFNNSKDFLDFVKSAEEQFCAENGDSALKLLENEIKNFFNSKRSIYTENPKLVSDDSMNDFLNKVLNDKNDYIYEISFLYSLSNDNDMRLGLGVKSELKHIDKLLNKYIVNLADKSIFFVSSQENWEDYYVRELGKSKSKIHNIMNIDQNAVKEIIREIKGSSGKKIALEKVYLDESLFTSIYTNKLPNIFLSNKFIKFKHQSTILCTCKCISNLLKKFLINISDSNLHLKEHFKNKEEIESKVLEPTSNLSYSGKFNVHGSVFAKANNIKDMFNTPLDGTIIIVSTYFVEKESNKSTNYIFYIYSYKENGFLKTGNVYSKCDKKWNSAYAMVIVKDEKGNLITAHPRKI